MNTERSYGAESWLTGGYFFQIRYKTNEPVWEENFTFFIHNPKCQALEVEVFYLHS